MIAMIGRVASGLSRCIIVLALLAMLPMSVFGLAASGSRLSDPDASTRVATTFLVYIAHDLLALFSLIKLHRRLLAWLFAAAIAAAPTAASLIVA